MVSVTGAADELALGWPPPEQAAVKIISTAAPRGRFQPLITRPPDDESAFIGNLLASLFRFAAFVNRLVQRSETAYNPTCVQGADDRRRGPLGRGVGGHGIADPKR